MKGFDPCFFDKLFDDEPKSSSVSPALRRLSLDELKDTVAADLEGLLNTRCVADEKLLVRYPECQRSLVTYGLVDIAGRSLASFYDRERICKSLEAAISRHETRLRNVRVILTVDQNATSVLHFSIQGLLCSKELDEPVSFDATLLPTNLQYAVCRSKKSAFAS